MEERLDQVEEGRENWKDLLGSFYGDFEKELRQAEQDQERIKIPDEVSEEICPVCGRQLVVKSGRFGRFLACPGYPECTFTQPIVVEMPGKCPKCGGRILKKTSKRGYTYYGCEFNVVKEGSKATQCDFMTWDVPVKDNCPECGWTMFKKSGRGFKKPFCINPGCGNFTPEDKRGGYKKKAAEPKEGEAAPAEESAEKKTTKKTAAKKTTAKKTAAEKKPAEKKTTAKAASAKKPAAKKTAAAKTTTKKTAAKKTDGDEA